MRASAAADVYELWPLVAGLVATAIALIVIGILGGQRRIGNDLLRATMPGWHAALILLGVGVLMFATYALPIEVQAFRRWWFLPPNEPGDWLGSMWGNPITLVMMSACLVAYWSYPTPRKVRVMVARLRDPKTRGAQLRPLLLAPIGVLGGVLGGVAAWSLVSGPLQYPAILVAVWVVGVVVGMSAGALLERAGVLPPQEGNKAVQPK